MTEAEAIVWCVEHMAEVSFTYLGRKVISGDGCVPRVAVRAEREGVMGRFSQVTVRFEAETFLDAVSGAAATFAALDRGDPPHGTPDETDYSAAAQVRWPPTDDE